MQAPLDFQLLFEQSPDILLVLAPDAPRFTMIGATEARLHATHATREETVGKGLFEAFPDNPDDPAATGSANLRASLERVLATRAPDTMAVQKYDIRGPDGSFQVKYWSPKNIPVLSPTGQIVYILHRVEDVTDLVQAHEVGQELRDRTHQMEREVMRRSQELAAANRELRDANAKLGELDAAKTAFFSDVSHEFRTPLTLMLGPLEDALADGALAPTQRTRIELARDNALRLLKLVNALLDFSRLEAGRLRAHFAPLDAGVLTAELAGMFQSAIVSAGLSYTISSPPLSEPVFVDRDMWEKIVINLVSNAFKFTLNGEIAVELREEGSQVVLEVVDTGVGIPEAEQPRVFERFHRVVGSAGRTQEGTGIGLSLVRELVELHGGQVSVTSAPGRGTSFRVELKRGHAHLPAEAVSQSPVDPSLGRDAVAHVAEAARWANKRTTPETPVAAGKRPYVLVVDDNPDLRTYITGLLSPTYEVATAVDGQEGLEAVRARRPDVVLSDVMMPRLDGLGLLRALRSDAKTGSIPVILLSARAGEEAAIEGLDAGSDDYLVKPFSARELLARVRTHIDMARARRAWIEELEQANRELDAFAHSVAHDLRAPLWSIDGFTAAVLEDYGDRIPDEGKRHLERVRTASKRMGELIDGLLVLAKVTRGQLQREPVDLTLLAREVAAAREAGRRTSWRIHENLRAEGDSRLLRAVLDNLLGNALKFTRKQSEPQIEVGRRDDVGGRTFFVSDNGAGFDMARADKLFGTFQRLHGAEYEGHGIGLATVERIVRRHGGRIWAEGAVGKGATFYFTLG